MIHSSMKHFVIQILEFVRSKPAHKLPVLFTLEECPLPNCSESPEEVFQEVFRMVKEGLIEAYVIRDMKSNPKEIEVRYVTVVGANHLERPKGQRSGGQTLPDSHRMVPCRCTYVGKAFYSFTGWGRGALKESQLCSGIWCNTPHRKEFLKKMFVE